MSSKHPSRDLLLRHAAGEASEGASLAVAAHLTYCAACRAEVAKAEALAGALLHDQACDNPPSFDAVRERLDDQAPTSSATSAPAPVQAGPLPHVVSRFIGVDFDDIAWKFRLPGVSEYEISTEEGDAISLLRVKPGAKIPQHTHKGQELTVVFSGTLLDGDQAYGVGDISVADEHVDHVPRAGEDEPCICLAVLTDGLTFTGRFGRALNLFS